MEKKTSISRIIGIIGIFALLIVILIMVIVYKVKYEDMMITFFKFLAYN